MSVPRSESLKSKTRFILSGLCNKQFVAQDQTLILSHSLDISHHFLDNALPKSSLLVLLFTLFSVYFTSGPTNTSLRKLKNF